MKNNNEKKIQIKDKKKDDWILETIFSFWAPKVTYPSLYNKTKMIEKYNNDWKT